MDDQVEVKKLSDYNQRITKLENELGMLRAERSGLVRYMRRLGLPVDQPVVNAVTTGGKPVVKGKSKLSPAEQKARDDAYWASMQAEGTVALSDDIDEAEL